MRPLILPRMTGDAGFFFEMFKYYIVLQSPIFVDERYYEIRGLKLGYCYLSSTCILCSIALSHETRIRICHERFWTSTYINVMKNPTMYMYMIQYHSTSSTIRNPAKSSTSILFFLYQYIMNIHNLMSKQNMNRKCDRLCDSLSF